MEREGMQIDLKGAARFEEDTVSIEYALDNHSGLGIYAYLGTDDGTRKKILHRKAYTSLSPDGGSLHLLLGFPPCPPLLQVGRGIMPAAVLIEPGQIWEGQIDLKLPVMEWSPYARVEYPEECPTVNVDLVRLTVEYTSVEGLLFLEPGPEPGWFWVQGRTKGAVELSIGLPETVEIIQRTDDFLRF
jgi:hypothetical protein